MRPNPRSLYWDLAPSLKLTQTNRADRQEMLRFSQEKQGWGAQSQFPIWSLVFCWEGRSLLLPHPGPQALLTHSGTGWCHPPGRNYRSCRLQRRHVGYVWFVTQALTQVQEMVTPARGCNSSSQHHQCSKPLKSSQEICTRAFLPCLQQRLKESSFSKCSSYELAGFSPDQVGRTPAESCVHHFLCTTKGKSSSHQGLDRCGSHSSQLDSFTSLALYAVHKVIPYAVSWTPLRWKQSTLEDLPQVTQRFL